MFFIFNKSKKRKEIIALLYLHQAQVHHSLHVANLASDIFSQTHSLHHLPPRYVFYLEMAALLHDIGLVSGVKSHHKISYQMIMNARFKYLSEKERLIVAAIARYHRKAFPAVFHRALRPLTAKDRKLVLFLASILRIADGLDKSHTQSVKKVKLRFEPDELQFIILGYCFTDEDIVGVYRKAQLFSRTFSQSVKFLF